MVATGGTPFTMDMAVQIAQTKGFLGLVDAATANNQQMMAVADSALAANQGDMSQAFQMWMQDIHNTAVSNNQMQEGIHQALSFGIGATDATEGDNASTFQSLTGALGSPVSGAHFGS